MSRSPRIRLAWTAALALPLIALGALWAHMDYRGRQGEDWLIPIEGYDPRDLLRGHFIQYRYAWPAGPGALRGSDRQPIEFDPNLEDALCIRGTAPDIREVIPLSPADEPAEADCAIVARATLGTRREVQGLDRGIFYASQEGAAELSRKLNDPRLQALLKVRIRADGVMRPIEMLFRPKPPENTR